jgi:hypothetical protein
MDDAELDRELNAALTVSPSPQFVPMVRSRIAQQGHSLVFLHRLKPIAVAVSLGVVGIAITYRETPRETFLSPATLSSRQFAALARPQPVVTSLKAMSRPETRSPETPTPESKMPEVIIASDTRDGLMQFIASARERRFEASFDETPASTPWAMSELVVAPLTIEPLTRPAADNN